MGQVREVELTEADISSAINETEKEIAGLAWGDEETEAADPSGDRSLESIGEGLEGQHEEDEDETEGEESEDESETEGEGEEEGEQPPAAAKKGAGEELVAGKQQTETEEHPTGRVPSGKLREANERARTLQAERDAERAARAEESKKLTALEAQLATLTQLMQGRQAPQQPAPVKEEPKAAPDLFENPTGFVDHITRQIEDRLSGVQRNLQEQAVNTSFRIAHVRHADTFQEAWTAVNKLDPNNPDDRATAQRIYNSPDPGEALVAWHKRSVALSRVGNDPDAYEARIRKETQEALMKDPEFRKQLVASLRAEAQQGDDGRPRTTTRLPTSVGRASGSNLGAREARGAMDESEQSVADAAWR